MNPKVPASSLVLVEFFVGHVYTMFIEGMREGLGEMVFFSFMRLDKMNPASSIN